MKHEIMIEKTEDGPTNGLRGRHNSSGSALSCGREFKNAICVRNFSFGQTFFFIRFDGI